MEDRRLDYNARPVPIYEITYIIIPLKRNLDKRNQPIFNVTSEMFSRV